MNPRLAMRRTGSTSLRRALVLGSMTAAALLFGCDGGVPALGSGSTISPEAFVEAMVQLRTSASLHPSGYLPEGEPERILAELGLTPADLREFVEVHGADVQLMARVWDEIDTAVNEARVLRAR